MFWCKVLATQLVLYPYVNVFGPRVDCTECAVQQLVPFTIYFLLCVTFVCLCVYKRHILCVCVSAVQRSGSPIE